MSIALVHISDLHFHDDFDPSLTDQTGSPWSGVRSHLLPQGYMPHAFDAAVELELAVRRWTSQNRPALSLVTVTGDLTITGTPQQFATSLSYLRSEVLVSWFQRTGLGRIEANWAGMALARNKYPRVFAVPGNHDHWQGNHLAGIANIPWTDLHGRFFPKGPGWVQTITVGSTCLQLIGLDSTLGPGLRLAARGKLTEEQITHVQGLLKEREHCPPEGKNLVRVLLVHHSIGGDMLHAYSGGSLERLKSFVEDYKINVILTGHVHLPSWPDHSDEALALGSEFRCGTTLQGAARGREPSPWGQTFFVHEITTEDSENPKWITTLFMRRTTTGLTSFHEFASPTVYPLR